MPTQTSPPIGYVRIFSRDPRLSVTARLGDDRPNVESGYGGWEEVERPRRSPLTTFKASPALRVSLPILLDGYASGTEVEAPIARLERMARPVAANGEPPRVFYDARGSALPYQGRGFVIDSISWGDALMNSRGNRVRQAATLALLEYVEDVYLAQKSAANRRRAKATAAKRKQGAPAKRITAKKVKAKRIGKAATDDDFGTGEDLLAIAARVLGDADRWVEIAQLNGLRDPRAIAPGQVLRLP